jgi:hypothetical protein
MMGRRLNVFLAMLWGPICTRGNLTGSVAKMRPAAKTPKSTHRNNGGGQGYGFKAVIHKLAAAFYPVALKASQDPLWQALTV